MNINKATTIILILGFVTTILNYLVGIVPQNDVIYVTLALSIISEITNAIKSGYADKSEVEPVQSVMNEDEGC